MVQSLIRFLIPFQEATDVLQASKAPTLHQVVPYRRTLISHLTPTTHEPKYISQLKRIALELLMKKFKLDSLHRVATFLNPKMRGLKPLTHEERQETIEDVRKLIAEVKLSVSSEEMEREAPTTSDHGYAAVGDQPRRKIRKISAPVECWEDEEVQSDVSNALSEIDMYRNLPLATDEEFNIMSWWRNQSAKLPRLSQIARYILSVPASSAPSERNFSVAGLTVSKLRNKLSPKNVDDLLFLRSNMDLLDK